jgi:hypothetical protein
MAWRIEEHVARGELDCRVRGRVTGRFWWHGQAAPFTLELEGRPWRDLAGCLLRFTNSQARAGDATGLVLTQRGVIGDLTASRKIKVPDCSMDELMEYYKRREPFPWHWGNSLYLEWFGEQNGRVVVEAAHYTLELATATPTWVMTEAEEAEQRQLNGRAMTDFMQRLCAPGAVPVASHRGGAAISENEDDDAPTTAAEAAAEAEAARLALLVDRVTARFARDGRPKDPAEYARVLAEERARLRRERGEPEPAPQGAGEPDAADAEEFAALIAATFDPELDEGLIEAVDLAQEPADDDAQAAADAAEAEEAANDEGEEEWPELVLRCQRLTDWLMDEMEAQGWLDEEAPTEHPLRELEQGVMLAGVKLAGVFAEREWPPPVLFAGDVLVRLKKAREHLRDARAGLLAAEEQGLTTPAWRATARLELESVLAHVDGLVAELRGVLEREESGG